MTNPSAETIKLLPCPFCGTKARYSYSEEHYYIECLGCRVEVKGGSYENITKRWNTRAYRSTAECGRGEEADDKVEVIYIELGHGEYGVSAGILDNDPALIISRLDSPEEVGALLPPKYEISGGETIICFNGGRGLAVVQKALNHLAALIEATDTLPNPAPLSLNN